MKSSLVIPAILALGCAWDARAQSAPDLSALSLDELLSSTVTSVAKRPQTVETASSAVFVLTAEDIRRSGAGDLPDVLRLVPGLEVTRTAGGAAAVSSRGFNGPFANKLLVLIDGRAVNLATTTGGVWDQQLTPLDQIERIEVVRGPGGAEWGGNAVNGIISIVTKHPVDTQGLAVEVRLEDRGVNAATVSLGWAAGPGAGRAYYTQRERLGEVGGRQAGLRYDIDLAGQTSMTLQADWQNGRFEPLNFFDGAADPAGRYSGLALAGRMVRDGKADGRWTLQTSWRRETRTEQARLTHDQIDLELSRLQRWGLHDLTLGVESRSGHDSGPATRLALLPDDRRLGAYVQDDLSVLGGRARVSVGAKLEHNNFTGFELQPTARLWTRTPVGAVWAAYSRAARPPSRFESASGLIGETTSTAPGLTAEVVDAYEIGWRSSLGSTLTFDLAAYRNYYHDLILWLPKSGVLASSPNGGRADSHGLELAVEAKPSPRWTIKTAASWLNMDVRLDNPAAPVVNFSPAQQLSIRSWYDLTDTVELDAWLRGGQPLLDKAGAAYVDLDLRLGWRVSDRLELSLAGRNLLHDHRREFNALKNGQGALAPRAVALTLTYRR